MKNSSKALKIALIAALITTVSIAMLTGAYYTYKHSQNKNLQGPEAPAETTLEEVKGPQTAEVQDTFPSSLNIELPFYTQAPHSNWDYPWQEACEEASVLLVANLYNDLNLELEPYNTELLRLVDWEVEYFGAYEHTTVDQTAEMLSIQYDLESTIHMDPSFTDIQEILNRGNLIVAPFAGKLLGNPNFRNGGPNYHMLVIKGYNTDDQESGTQQIVTHDVGTRNGENYVYDWSVIQNALHNWHDTDITLGEKQLIEVIAP
jgi:hypothetical protein